MSLFKQPRNKAFSTHSLLKKGFSVLLLRASAALFTFVVTLYLARLLGTDGFGAFSLALTVIAILSMIGRLGLDSWILREIASHHDSASSGFARKTIYPIFLLVIPFAILLLLTIIQTSSWITTSIFDKPDVSLVLVTLSPLILFLTIGFILGEAFKSINKPYLGTLLQNVAHPLFFLLAVFLASFVAELNLIRISTLYSFTSLILVLVSIHIWLKTTKPSHREDYESPVSILKKSGPLLLISSGGLLLSWTDTIVLGIFETKASIGIYTVAIKTALATSLILIAINTIVTPKFSLYFASKDIQNLKTAAKYSTRVGIIVAFIPTLILISAPKFVLSFFGEGFEQGAHLLVLFSLVQFFTISCGPVGNLLLMTHNETILKSITFISASINLLLSVILVQFYGITGVAIATISGIVFYNMSCVYFVKKKLGFWMIG